MSKVSIVTYFISKEELKYQPPTVEFRSILGRQCVQNLSKVD